MASSKKFSRFIAWTLVLFEAVSLTIVVGVLYAILSRSITKEFFQGLQVKQVEVSTALQDRLNSIQADLREISLNNSVRVSLMLGVKSQLLDILKRQYPNSNGAYFFVLENDNSEFAPKLPENLHFLRPSLRELPLEGHPKPVIFRNFGSGKFISLFSIPIKRRDDRLGRAFAIYDISRDAGLWKFVSARSLSKIFIEHYGSMYDLQTGKGKRIPMEMQTAIGKGLEPPWVDRYPGLTVNPLKGFPGVLYAIPSAPFQERKESLVLLLAGLCASVFLLTLLVSVIIARRMSEPLESMADQALEIAKEPSTSSLNEDEIKHIEFRKLAQAFNQVLMSLLEAQEELKRRAERELEASEERYRRTLEAAPDVITITRVHDGRYLQVNEAFLQVTGYSQEEALGKTPLDLNLYVKPEDRNRFVEILKEKGEANGIEIQLRRKEKTVIDTLLSARLVRFGEEDCMVSVITDITERKRAEEELKQQRSFLRQVLDINPNFVFAKDREGRFTLVNEAVAEAYGATVEDLIGRTDADFNPNREEVEYFRCADLAVMDSLEEKFIPEEKITDSTGRVRWLQTVKRPITTEDGAADQILGVSTDITDRKRAEEERVRLEKKLQQAQKMEAMGMLAGGVAHDLNNILSGLVSYPELLLIDLEKDSPLRQPLLIIQDSGKKAATIVQDLLTLARRGVAVKEVVNLNDVISEYLNSLEHEKLKSFHQDVRVVTDMETELLNVLGSPVHLSKVVMNLVANAAEAMPVGGDVIISTSNRYIDKPIRGYDDVEEGDYVVLSVNDTGIGISLVDRRRIFEPFYTKKVMGRSGTGLGMSVVWTTVKDHKGYIDVQSSEGEGTQFDLYFPITRQVDNDKDARISLEDYLGNEKILVIDDVEEQRKIATMMLSKLGYEVTAVSSGEEAVEYMKNSSAELLVLDMIMDPGIDGLETYRRIIELRPGQKAIIASGFSETDRVKEAQRLGAGAYIKKPYTLEKIGLAVRKELDR